jgi:epoxyqueuosine reductase QueG
MENLIILCQDILNKNKYDSLSHFSKNIAGLQSTFPHKTAATKAGLGWIGKNALLVTNDFGCGVRLGTVLTDAPVITGEPVTESKCGDCTLCMDACPYNAIRGKNWYPGISRDSLLNASLCNEKREEMGVTLGYKHPCGLCLQVCPVGKDDKR